ncbi:MAG: TonB-dependent receptor [Nibricoccus sp.]
MPSFQRSRLTGLLFRSIALATAIASLAHAQTTTVETASAAPTHDSVPQLDKYVVSASRTPTDPRNVPNAVTFVKLEELTASQVPDLRTALAAQPGVMLVSTGAKGAQSTIYMRGAAADQVLLFVDGIRMNTTEAGYANFLGGADLVGIDRLEILRGPQSTLYGSSAMGGVITLNTTHGCGGPIADLSVETGSFDTFAVSAAVQGGTQTVGYSASLSRTRTDNDRADNGFKATSYSSRVEWTPFKGLLVGGTVRGQKGRFEEPGTNGGSKGIAEVPNHLVTAYVQWQPIDGVSTRLTHGWHQTEYTWTDITYGPTSNYYARNTREVLDWQNSWDAFKWLQLVGGINAEWAHYTNGGVKLTDDQNAIYASASFRPLAGLTIDVGDRKDEHELDGGATTGRAGVSYFLKPSGTKFRATYGTGFKVPSMINRNGSEPWYGASPDVKPEKSKGWDAGIDQELLDGKLTASATYFHNDFEDLIVSNYKYLPAENKWRYIAENVNKAYTEGAEFALSIEPIQFVKLKTSYTYLTAIDDSKSGKPVRLVRRPRHTGDVELQVLPTTSWIFGVGVHFVGSREESVYNPATYSSKQVDTENYAVARAFISYRTSDNAYLKLRVENVFNEKYAEAFGYEALPRGVFGGVELKF